MIDRFLVLPEDPIAILAHDRQSMQHHRLARADEGTPATLIQLLGELEIRIVHAVRQLYRVAGSERAAAPMLRFRAVIARRPPRMAQLLPLLVALVPVGAAGASAAAAAVPSPQQPPAAAQATLRDRIVAVVDGDPILQSDVERALALGTAPSPTGANERDQRRRVLDGLIEERLRIHEVERYGFEQVPVEMIAKQVETIRARFPSDEAFQQRLQALGMTLEGLDQLVAQQLQ
ncbi:MAG TPA: SurA N-terminal domain-containing protein, partial [Thermoanaerobaculia bacterium]|nr:SurA N-terminal domain-containing protein [Thermoanaerobaculia bacterium]